MSRHLSMRAQNGLALVVVLWILTLLTLMAGSFATTMRRETSVSSAIKNNAEAFAVAESGIELAKYMLKQPDPERRWRGDGTVYQLLRPDGELRIRILAESGKVDINASNEAQLNAVLKMVTGDSWQQQSLLNAILDWRDADDDTRTMGAEKKQYRQAGLTYGPSNNAFQTLEELQLVLGMNEAIFSKIQPWITVYSGNPEVNQKEAAPELLAILAEELKDRNVHDQALENRLDEADEQAGGDETFTSLDQTYTIIAQVLLNDEAAAGLEVVLQLQSSGDQALSEVLDWKQNNEGLSLFDDATGYPLITIHDEFTYDDRS